MGVPVAVCEGRGTAIIRDNVAYLRSRVAVVTGDGFGMRDFEGNVMKGNKVIINEKCPLLLRRQEKSGLCSHFSGCPLGWSN